MSLWTNKDRPSLAEDADDFANTPQGGAGSIWFGGVAVPAALVIYAVVCLVSDEVNLPSWRWGGGTLLVRGPAATSISVAWLALGLFLHFHYYWGLHAKLHRHSQLLKSLSLIVFIPCLLYGAVVASNILSWFQ